MSSYHVLIIEDNPGDIELLREAFHSARLDCSVTTFDNGESALAFVSESTADASAPADIILLDINLPRIDGLSLLEAIRRSSSGSEVPIVVMSSSTSPKEKERIAAFKNTTLIIKPANLDKFLEIGGLVKSLLSAP